MTGTHTTQTTPHTGKAPAQSAKTSARAPMKGQTFMAQPTRPLPEVDEKIVASWPAGPDRTQARNAYRLLLSAGAALENLLQDDAAAVPAGRNAEIQRAAAALSQIRMADAPASSYWRMEVDSSTDEPVTLTGAVYEFEHPRGLDLRAAIGRWAEVVDGTVTERTTATGAVHLDLAGEYAGVPVSMVAIINAPAGGEVA